MPGGGPDKTEKGGLPGARGGERGLTRSGSAPWNQGEPLTDPFASNTKRKYIAIALEFAGTLMRVGIDIPPPRRLYSVHRRLGTTMSMTMQAIP